MKTIQLTGDMPPCCCGEPAPPTDDCPCGPGRGLLPATLYVRHAYDDSLVITMTWDPDAGKWKWTCQGYTCDGTREAWFWCDLENCNPHPDVGNPTYWRFKDCEDQFQCSQHVGCSGMVAYFSPVDLCEGSMEVYVSTV